jgi:hypothetical protein
VTPADKEYYINDIREQMKAAWESFKNKVNLRFPEYFPPFSGFEVADGKIFAYSHKSHSRYCQLYIFNFKGNLLQQKPIQLKDSHQFYQDFQYYLKENEETENWELHRERIL